MSKLDEILKQYQNVESTLKKLENMWSNVLSKVTDDITFKANPRREVTCRQYEQELRRLPPLRDWKPEALPVNLDEISLLRLNATEQGNPRARFDVEQKIMKPGKELREYRFLFNRKRQQFVREAVLQISLEVDQLVEHLQESYLIEREDEEQSTEPIKRKIDDLNLKLLDEKLQKITALLELYGEEASRLQRWHDLGRHLYYAQIGDLQDIVRSDWPAVRQGLVELLKTNDEPLSELPEFSNQDESTTQKLNELLDMVEEASSADEKGKSLENLVSSLFETIPGFTVQSRIRTATEEIDIEVLNDSNDPYFRREEVFLLVECKNWTQKCGKNEFVLFRQKIENRSSRCSLGFLVSWNDFKDTITKEMLRGSRERTLVVPITGKDIRAAIQNQDFEGILKSCMSKSINI